MSNNTLNSKLLDIQHFQVKGYSLLSGAGSMAACSKSVNTPSTMEL